MKRLLILSTLLLITFSINAQLKLPAGWKIIPPKLNTFSNCFENTSIECDFDKDGDLDIILSIYKGDETKTVAFRNNDMVYKYIEIYDYVPGCIGFTKSSGVLSLFECESSGIYFKWNGYKFKEFNSYE